MAAHHRALKKIKTESNELHLLPLVLLRCTLEFLSDASSIRSVALCSKQDCARIRDALYMTSDVVPRSLGYTFKEIEDLNYAGFISGYRGFGHEHSPLRVDWDMLGRHLLPFADLSMSTGLLLRHVDLKMDNRLRYLDTATGLHHHRLFRFDMREPTGFVCQFSGTFHLRPDGECTQPVLEFMKLRCEAPTTWSVGYFMNGSYRRMVFGHFEDGVLTVRAGDVRETSVLGVTSFSLDTQKSQIGVLLEKQAARDFRPISGSHLVCQQHRMRLVLYGLDRL